jgi:nitric oxide reductase NorD protein
MGLPYPHHAEAAVPLAAVAAQIPPFFRALGGDPGLKLQGGERQAHAWHDAGRLFLPDELALFADAELNRALYFWLAALAAEPEPAGDWLTRNRLAAATCLARMPGLAELYHRLVLALLPLRPDPATLDAPARAGELAIRAALLTPEHAPPAVDLAGVLPVPLWLHPSPPAGPPWLAPGARKQSGQPAPASVPDG